MTNLGIPSVPAAQRKDLGGGITFSSQGHYFETTLSELQLEQVAESSSAPLSVIYQVTRRCNFDCTFCSEIERIKDPSLEDIQLVKERLRGVPRVFISGGEPLIRRDIIEVIELFCENHIVSIPTNATRGPHLASSLAGKIDFVNIGLEGPRSITDRVRGNYDKIMKGAFAFREAGIPISFSAVVLRSLIDDLPYLIQIADVLQAGKVKLIHPIRKGNGANLEDSEFLSLKESEDLFGKLVALREKYQWSPSLRMTTWTRETEGYSVLIYPDATVWAWPVYGGYAEKAEQGGTADKTLYLGDLNKEGLPDIWARYPFKVNHFRKYLGKSIFSCHNGSMERVIRVRQK